MLILINPDANAVFIFWSNFARISATIRRKSTTNATKAGDARGTHKYQTKRKEATSATVSATVMQRLKQYVVYVHATVLFLAINTSSSSFRLASEKVRNVELACCYRRCVGTKLQHKSQCMDTFDKKNRVENTLKDLRLVRLVLL